MSDWDDIGRAEDAEREEWMQGEIDRYAAALQRILLLGSGAWDGAETIARAALDGEDFSDDNVALAAYLADRRTTA